MSPVLRKILNKETFINDLFFILAHTFPPSKTRGKMLKWPARALQRRFYSPRRSPTALPVAASSSSSSSSSLPSSSPHRRSRRVRSRRSSLPLSFSCQSSQLFQQLQLQPPEPVSSQSTSPLPSALHSELLYTAKALIARSGNLFYVVLFLSNVYMSC